MKLKLDSTALLIAGLITSPVIYAQSYEEALLQTLETNPNIKESFHNFKVKSEEIGIRKGNYLPSINVNAQTGIIKNRVQPDQYNSNQASLTIEQLIWDGNLTLNDIDRVEEEAEASRYGLYSTVNDIALKVSKVYLDVLQAQENVYLANENNQHLNTIYDNIKKRVNAGIDSSTDLTQAQSRLARSDASVLAAKSNLNDKQSQFIRITGHRPVDLVMPEVDQEIMPRSLKVMLDTAKENNPTIQLALHDIEAAKYKYKLTKGNFLPKITLQAGQTWGSENSNSNSRIDESQVALKVSYNLFSGGSDTARSRQAAYDLEKTKDIYENSLRELSSGAQLSWDAYTLYSQQKSFLQDHVLASTKTLNAYKKQYLIGQRSLLDVLNTENEVYESKRNYVQAQYGEIEAKYRILNSTSSLLKASRVNADPQWNKSVL
ncbi:TolC family outer membrane protein [uncultured Photobacterium sp.]|uniref:TolC family outer membrane protein n=1 Tax=uncultured Photobacterium sp. TaxID=173973 RepID=UPI0026375110|nr:TolC family outer membrane protein [uncultured Photobacterium sp.]